MFFGLNAVLYFLRKDSNRRDKTRSVLRSLSTLRDLLVAIPSRFSGFNQG